MFRLDKGMEICADAHVVSDEIFANEALLTDESVPIRKGERYSLLSGSFVMSGSCIAKADRVGDACYANTIAKEAKKLKGNSSIILASLNKIVRFTSYFIVPLGAVLFYESYFAAALPLKESVVTASAALLGLLPKGLVLLTSVSLAVGVIRLGKKQTLVQELYAIESLARRLCCAWPAKGALQRLQIPNKSVPIPPFRLVWRRASCICMHVRRDFCFICTLFADVSLMFAHC